MQLTWGTLVLMVLAGLVVWFWQDSLRVRERANAAAIEACTRLALQFLDGTVAFTRLRFVRESGQLQLRRTYVFDYTAHSIERLQGFVVLLGMRVESVGFARAELQRVPAVDVTNSSGGSTLPVSGLAQSASTDAAAESAKILDLDDWRRNRDQRQ